MTDAVTLFAQAMRSAIAARGVGLAALSGGNTPRATYRAMAKLDLPWEKIVVTLVDERWVDETLPDSNARLVRKTLLQGPAAAARFVALKGVGATPDEDARAADAQLRALPLPFDFMLLGVGEDGHFASLFPLSPVLEAGLALGNKTLCMAVPAGENGRAPSLPRLTLTLAEIARTRTLVLLLTEGKRKVLEAAKADQTSPLPLRALLEARPDIAIVWMRS
ncbi:MAG: 6-phosphogluconolactonase [Alphaproteobacteria bacterium]|nr:6-phosphogluconolactonase [Alphaproteobacteria bacterium]